MMEIFGIDDNQKQTCFDRYYCINKQIERSRIAIEQYREEANVSIGKIRVVANGQDVYQYMNAKQQIGLLESSIEEMKEMEEVEKKKIIEFFNEFVNTKQVQITTGSGRSVRIMLADDTIAMKDMGLS